MSLAIFLGALVVSILLTKTNYHNRISAKILADSITVLGCRLTTFEVVYPRWIIAEINTHRMFSRNAASSRAIPIQEMLKAVLRHPAQFVFWGRNRPGMQSTEELTGWRLMLARKLAMWLRYPVCVLVYLMYKIGLHKQSANRYLEPWLYVTMIISATEFENFRKLRAHKDAQPEFQDLAFKMVKLLDTNKPRLLHAGSWHLPMINPEDYDAAKGLAGQDYMTILRKVSAARIARVSYVKQNLVKTIDDDFKLHDRLVNSGHNSPLEHQAMAMATDDWSGNFQGWMQYRKFFAGEDGRKKNL